MDPPNKKPPPLKETSQYRSIKRYQFNRRAPDPTPIQKPALKHPDGTPARRIHIEGCVSPSAMKSAPTTRELSTYEEHPVASSTLISGTEKKRKFHSLFDKGDTIVKIDCMSKGQDCTFILRDNITKVVSKYHESEVLQTIDPKVTTIKYQVGSSVDTFYFSVAENKDPFFVANFTKSGSTTLRTKMSEIYSARFLNITRELNQTILDEIYISTFPQSGRIKVSAAVKGLYVLDPPLYFRWESSSFTLDKVAGRQILHIDDRNTHRIDLCSSIRYGANFARLINNIRNKGCLTDLTRPEEVAPHSFYANRVAELAPISSPLTPSKEGKYLSKPIASESKISGAKCDTSVVKLPGEFRDETSNSLSPIKFERSLRASPKEVVEISSEGEERPKRAARTTNQQKLVEPTQEDYDMLKEEKFHSFSYKFWDGKSFDVTIRDIARLNPQVYVNDTIIWFFLRLYTEALAKKDSEMADKICLLDTFFYTSLRSGTVPPWVSKIPLTSKDCLIMPINDTFHWVVALIIGLNKAIEVQDGKVSEHKVVHDGVEVSGSLYKPAIIILDSLGSPVRGYGRKVITALNNALKAQNLNPIGVKNFRILKADVPTQPNSTDCGVYLIHFIEQFLANPLPLFSAVDVSAGATLNVDAEYWKPSQAWMKRIELKQILKNIGDIGHKVQASEDEITESWDDLEVVEVETITRKKNKQRQKEQSILVEGVETTKSKQENATMLIPAVSSSYLHLSTTPEKESAPLIPPQTPITNNKFEESLLDEAPETSPVKSAPLREKQIEVPTDKSTPKRANLGERHTSTQPNFQ